MKREDDKRRDWSTLGQSKLEASREEVYANLPRARALDPDSIHDLRVSLRRLRVVLRVFADLLDPALRREVRARAKALFAVLGAVRDLDLVWSELAARGPALARLRRRVGAERAARVERLRAELSQRRTRGLIRGLDALRARPDVGHPRRRARRELAVRQRKVVKLLIRGGATDTKLHLLRREVKNLRYRVELLGALFGRRKMGAYAKRLAQLQTALGALHDKAVAKDVLEHLMPPRSRTAEVAALSKFLRQYLVDEEADAHRVLARARRWLGAHPPFE